MLKKGASARVSLLLLVLGVLTAGSAFAGSLIVGSVAGATNASLGGQALVAGNTVFSGDSLRVSDGSAVVMIGSGSRMVFGKDSVASFGRNVNEVTAFLSKGDVSVYHPAEDSALLRLRIGSNLSIVPGKGFKTLGEVAMTTDTLIVTTKEGLLRVEGNGKPVEVTKGQSAKFIPKVSRSPQQAGGAQTYGGGSSAPMWIAVAAGAAAAILAGVAISRSNDARDAANAATAAANKADSDAIAAGSAATDANNNALAAGCALNKIFPNINGASPFVPAKGSCP